MGEERVREVGKKEVREFGDFEKGRRKERKNAD